MDCYNLNQFKEDRFSAGTESETGDAGKPGFFASSVNFVTGLCGGGRREQDMRGFNLMTFIISRE